MNDYKIPENYDVFECTICVASHGIGKPLPCVIAYPAGCGLPTKNCVLGIEPVSDFKKVEE